MSWVSFPERTCNSVIIYFIGSLVWIYYSLFSRSAIHQCLDHLSSWENRKLYACEYFSLYHLCKCQFYFFGWGLKLCYCPHTPWTIHQQILWISFFQYMKILFLKICRYWSFLSTFNHHHLVPTIILSYLNYCHHFLAASPLPNSCCGWSLQTQLKISAPSSSMTIRLTC